MAHGGYGKRRVNPAGRRSKSSGVEKKPKAVSLKNQIRSIERMLRKVFFPRVRVIVKNKKKALPNLAI